MPVETERPHRRRGGRSRGSGRRRTYAGAPSGPHRPGRRRRGPHSPTRSSSGRAPTRRGGTRSGSGRPRGQRTASSSSSSAPGWLSWMKATIEGLVGPGPCGRRARPRHQHEAGDRPRPCRAMAVARGGQPVGSGRRSGPRWRRRTGRRGPQPWPPHEPSTTRARPPRRGGGWPASAGTAPQHAGGSRPS